jgi:hypothetical protein
MPTVRRYVLLAVFSASLILSLGGCELFGLTDGRKAVVGTLDQREYSEEGPFSGPPVALSADTIAAGAPLTVTVRTVGAGCFEKGATEVRQDGQQATIMPYDRVDRDVLGRGGGTPTPCPALAVYFDHRADVTFASPGMATVRVRVALDDKNDSLDPGGPDTTITRTVVVASPS